MDEAVRDVRVVEARGARRLDDPVPVGAHDAGFGGRVRDCRSFGGGGGLGAVATEEQHCSFCCCSSMRMGRAALYYP